MFKVAREKGQVTYKGRPISLLNRDYENQKSLVMWTLRENKYQPRLLNPAKLSINIHGETKMFQD